MANTTTETKTESPLGASTGESGLLGPKKPGEIAKTPKPAPSEVPIVFRALMGFAGLALLVGFFFPWVRIGDPQTEQSGLGLLGATSMGGAPPVSVVLVPVLGALLSVTAFMGFRYAAYVAIGVSIVLFGYAAYVFFLLFIAHTAVGLWITTASAFVTLLLGAGTLIWMRRGVPKATKPASTTLPEPSSEKA